MNRPAILKRHGERKQMQGGDLAETPAETPARPAAPQKTTRPAPKKRTAKK